MELTAEKIILIIRQQYKDIMEAFREAEKDYFSDRKSVTKRSVYQYCAAQEAAINDLCYELGIDLYDDDLQLIE